MSRANRNLRGFLVHDERICFDNIAVNDSEPENSSYTQTAGRPGTATALDPLGTCRPHAHHAQEQDLVVVALRAGVPGTDLGIGYRADGDDAEVTRGWNDPNLVTAYQPIDWTTTTNWVNADAVTCPRSQRVVVVANDQALAVGPTVFRWNPVTNVWSAGEELDDDLPSTSHAACIAVLRENGRLLVFNNKIGTLETGVAQISFSDDDGDTWELFAEPELLSFADADNDRFRMVEDVHGNLLLIATDETTGDYHQYASTDQGSTFTEVESDTAWGTSPSLALTANGRIVVAYIDVPDGNTVWITLDDAFDPISEQTPATVSGITQVSHVACTVDYDGVVYVAMTIATSDLVRMARSVDDAASFEVYDRDVLGTGGTVADPTDHRHQIRALAPSGGHLVGVVTSTHTATTPSTDGSLLALTLGGWGNVEAPTGADGTSYSFLRKTRVAWADEDDQDLNGIFLPGETLANQGWTHTGTAETRVAGYHRFAAAAATSYATLTFAGSATTPTAVMFEAQVHDGGDIAADDVSFLYVRRDGADESRLRIRFAETGFRVRDDDSVTPSTLATVTIDMTAGVYQFLILSGHKITQGRFTTVYYRSLGSMLWIQAGQAELVSTATATTTDFVRVGVVQAATADIGVGMVGWAACESINKWLTGLDDVSNFTTRLRWGKVTGTRPYPVREQTDTDDNMLFLSASGGVGRLHERWQIPAEWDRGVREIHPVESPKPSAGWRSLDTLEQIITWDLGVDTRLGSSWGLGAALIRANFHQALIEASTDADPTNFVVLGAYIGFCGPLLNYTRSGDLVIPAAGATGDFFFAGGSLRGGQFILDPLNSPAGCRRILDNQSGGWVTDGAQSVLRIEGLDGTEPTSGQGYLVAPSGVLVMHHAAPVAYRRYRLRIPEQETPDGHFRLGKLVLGGLYAVGRQWSRGWSWRYVPITRTEEDDEGTIFVDPRGSDFSQSIRRELTVSFQDGYDESRIRNGTAPYLSAAAGTPALVADQDVWFQVQHILRITKAGSVPSVVLPEIPPTTRTLLDREMFSLGRLGVDQPWQVNNVQGDEGRSQVYRGEGLTHTELV